MTKSIFTCSCLLGFILFTSLGCVSGGKIVSKVDSDHVLVAYKPKGIFPPGTKWHLIRTEEGLALRERSNNGNGNNAIINHAWDDNAGHHFVIWASALGEQSTAFEYVVPYDHIKPASRYVYPSGSYTILKMNGVRRPVPYKPPHSPAALLFPVAKQ